MAAIEPFCHLIGIQTATLSREENLLFEIELYMRVWDVLKKYYREQLKPYFRLIGLTLKKEDAMLEANLIRLIIHDLLQIEHYTLEGIAIYTQTTLEIINDIAAGRNTAPSLLLSRKIIELHKMARPDLYHNTIKKIIADYQKREED